MTEIFCKKPKNQSQKVKGNCTKLHFPPQIECQKGDFRQKPPAPKIATPPHLFGRKMVKFRNGQTTNQETHNHKVNKSHETKHDLLIVRFWMIDVCSEMQKLPLPARTAPSEPHGDDLFLSMFQLRCSLGCFQGRSCMIVFRIQVHYSSGLEKIH